MIQQLVIENFLSFKDRVTFNMQPGRATKLKNHKAEPVKGNVVLKTAAIFGANAGGKSNFIKAIELGKRLVLQGTSNEELIEYKPFRLSPENKTRDTTLVYQILCNNKKYEYGFSYNAEKITEEWLDIITRKTTYHLFKRDNDNTIKMPLLLKNNNKEEEKQFLQFFAKATPLKQLFLHEVYSRNIHDNVSDISDIEAIISWFSDSLKIIFPDTPYKQGVWLKAADDDGLRIVFKALLKYFDTGIDDIYLKEVELDKLGIPQDLQRMIKADMSKSSSQEAFGALKLKDNLYLIKLSDGELNAKKLMTIHHQIGTSNTEYFSLEEESDGTKRLFDYIPLIIDFIYGNKVFIVDEIERSLHPTLIRKILDLFYAYSEDTPCQLIFTTHESSLMTQKLLRSDEIWLLKKKDGISTMSTIDKSYKPRFDKILNQSYLDGEYGAIPDLASNEKFLSFLKKMKKKSDSTTY